MLAKTTILLIAALVSLSSLAFGQTPPSARSANCSLVRNVTEQDVADSIFSKFNNWARPVRNVSKAVDVNLTLALSSISDVIEKARTVKLSGYLSIRWFDEFRVWNATFPLNCITYVVIPSTDIWLPDLALMNADTRYLLMQLDGEKVRVHSDGYAIYSPGGTFAVFCEFNLKMFPFDEQTCAIKIESWRYTHNFMTFNFFQTSVRKVQWLENEQWELTNTSQQLFGLSYLDPENTFDRVEFYIHMRRKASYYMIAIFIPGLLIALAQISIFSLPLEEVNKVYILFTCLLAYLVFQLMIVGDLPRSSDNTPLLSIYINVSMGLITMSIFGEMTVFVFLRFSRTHHEEGPGPVPTPLYSVTWFVAKFLHIRAHSLLQARPVFWRNNPKVDFIENSNKNTDGRSSTLATISENNYGTLVRSNLSSRPTIVIENDRRGDIERLIKIYRLEWRFVANVMDRITLCLYMLGVIVSPMIMFGIMPAL